jgi:hypothetical protein
MTERERESARESERERVSEPTLPNHATQLGPILKKKIL